jgi:hypothetical protein
MMHGTQNVKVLKNIENNIGQSEWGRNRSVRFIKATKPCVENMKLLERKYPRLLILISI